MIAATRLVTFDGEVLIVEAGEGRCWASEEVADIEVEVKRGTCCDICGRELGKRVADLIRRIRAKTEGIRQLRERRFVLRSRRHAVERWNAAHKPGDEVFVPGMNARVKIVSEAWGGFAELPTVRVRFKLGNELAIETSRLAEVPT